MLDITVEKWRIFWDGKCYTVATKHKEGYKDYSYYARLEDAIWEFIYHRKIAESEAKTLKELYQEIQEIRNDLNLMFQTNKNEMIELLSKK